MKKAQFFAVGNVVIAFVQENIAEVQSRCMLGMGGTELRGGKHQLKKKARMRKMKIGKSEADNFQIYENN